MQTFFLTWKKIICWFVFPPLFQVTSMQQIALMQVQLEFLIPIRSGEYQLHTLYSWFVVRSLCVCACECACVRVCVCV